MWTGTPAASAKVAAVWRRTCRLPVSPAALRWRENKRWAQAKTIHEKHVFQLYGTVVLARLENPGEKVSGTFTTTTKLSEKAREVAGCVISRSAADPATGGS